MADDREYLDWLPLFAESTEDDVLDRMIDWANEGLTPASALWVDTREGSMWRIAVLPCAREVTRLIDIAGVDVPASSSPLRAWGPYLDELAEVVDVARLAATAAEGTVRFTGPAATVIAAGTQVGVVPTSEDAPAPTYSVTTEATIPVGGTVDALVTALDAGVEGNVAAGAVTEVLTPMAGVTVTNPLPMAGGSDPETDFALRTRLLEAYRGQGAGNPSDYRRWARTRNGVGRATVVPVWNGPGTVKVIITDASGQPVSQAIIDDVQTFLDPVAAAAEGYAPIGAAITVETPTVLDIIVTAEIEPAPGYTVLGTTGTTALQPGLRAAIDAYLRTVESGGEVVLAQVRRHLAAVSGVHDLGAVTLSGAAANGNVPVPVNPPRVPIATTQTYTEITR